MTATPAGRSALRLRAAAEELPRVTGWVEKLLSNSGADDRDRFRVDLALTEAVTNILAHALAGQPAAEVDLDAALSGGTLRITVSDGGPAFDPLMAPGKALPTRLEDASPGGLGWVLIRSYTDEVHYARVGDLNLLTLVFRLGAPPAASR